MLVVAGLRLRFQPVGLTGRRVDTTPRKESHSHRNEEQLLCGSGFPAATPLIRG